MHIEDVSSHQRGDRASSRARGGMRWTRRRLGRTAPVRTAKSCRSDAPRPASSLREEAQATVSSKPGQREEREISRKTIARGMPGDFRCDRGDYARVLFYFACEAAGALSARHSLRPLISEGRELQANLARKPRRDREAMFIGALLFEM